MRRYALKTATSRLRHANHSVEGSLHAQVSRACIHATATRRQQKHQALCTGRLNQPSKELGKYKHQQQQLMYDSPKRGPTILRAARGPPVLAKASYANDPNGSSKDTSCGRSGVADIPPPPPLPPPHRHGVLRRAPPPLLQPLLNAVVTISGGRLALLPPSAVAWLLRTLLSVGHTPPPAWITEAYDILTAGVDALQPGQAATAYLAIASLAVSSGRTSELATAATGTAQPPPRSPLPPPPPPPPALLPGLYVAMARHSRTDTIGPRVALACLEEAAAAGESDTSVHASNGYGSSTAAVRQDYLELPSYCSNANAGDFRNRVGNELCSVRVSESTLPYDGDGGTWRGNSRRTSGDPNAPAAATAEQTVSTGDGAERPTSTDPWVSEPPPQQQWRQNWNLSPAMPRQLVELLIRRTVSLSPFDGVPAGAAAAAAAATAESRMFGPEAAVAAARAVIAAAHLAHPPRPIVLSYIATLISENCGGGGPFRTPASGSDRDGGSPPMLVHALSALCAMAAEPLPPPIVETLVLGLGDQLTNLDAVQISYCIVAVQRLAAEAASATALGFARGPAAAELTRQLPGLPAARLATALAALPPPLQPPPALLAAAAHEALRRGLAAADSDDLAEVLRQLSAADALPLYGWQGELAAALSRRLQDAAAAALISSQELCNTMFVLAALNYRPGFSWTAAAAAALQPRLLTLTPPQLTNALWALAKFGYRPESPWSTFAVQALQLQLPSLLPHQLSYGLGSLQRMGCHVNAAVLDEMLAAAAAQLVQYPPGELVLLLMTVARLRHVPSYSFTEAVTERLRPHLAAAAVAAAAAPTAAGVVPLDLRGPVTVAAPLPSPSAAAAPPLTCQELASVGYALAKLHSRPEPEWMSAYMDACLAAMGGFSPDLLASLLWAVGELGQVPSPPWISAFLAAARPRLGELAPQDLVSVLSSFAALRTPPPAEWLGEALTVLGARVGGLDGVGVTALLKALVDLDARVGNPKWYEALCDQVYPFLPLLPAETLVDLVSSLGTLGHKPRAEWLQRCSAAIVRAQAQAQAMKPAAVRTARPGGIDMNADKNVTVDTSRGGGGGSSSGGGGLSVQQLEALVCGMAKMGAVPPVQLLQAFFAATVTSLAVMSPDRVTAIASALAGAKVAPDPSWLDSLANAVRNDVMSYTLVQLDALTRALAVFQGLVPEHGATKDLLAFLREFCLYG